MAGMALSSFHCKGFTATSKAGNHSMSSRRSARAVHAVPGFSRCLQLCVIIAMGLMTILAQAQSMKTTEQHLDEAKGFLSAGKFNDALDSYDKAIELDGTNCMAIFRRGAVLLQLGKTSQALRDFGTVLKLKPKFDQALLQRGRLLLKACQLKEALNDLRDYVAAHPSDARAKESITDAEAGLVDMDSVDKLVASKQFEPALEALSRLSTTCPLATSIRLKRIDIYLDQGDKIMAVADLIRVSKLNPDDTTVLTKLAGLQLSIGETTAAMATLKDCLKQDPEHSKCKSLFRDLKKLDKAVKGVDTSAGLSSWNLVKQKLFGDAGVIAEAQRLGATAELRKLYGHACKAHIELKNAAEALKWCTSAVEADDTSVDALCNHGEANIMNENYEDAVRDYEKAHQLNQNDRRAHEGYHRAQRLQKLASKKDYYKILGVPRDASKRTVKKAFRKLAQVWHPDKYKGDLTQDQVLKKMSDINEAYEVLSDDEKREKFDNGEDPNDLVQQQAHYGNQQFFFHQGGGFPFGGGGQQFHFKF